MTSPARSLREAAEALAESLRVKMLKQPMSDARDTYGDGYAGGLAECVVELRALLAAHPAAATPEPAESKNQGECRASESAREACQRLSDDLPYIACPCGRAPGAPAPAPPTEGGESGGLSDGERESLRRAGVRLIVHNKNDDLIAAVERILADRLAARPAPEPVRDDLATSDYVLAACVCGRGIARHLNGTGWWHISDTFQVDHRAEPLSPAGSSDAK